jgi:hypothetical protein
VLKKAFRKNAEVPDVPADDPVGTMDRFTDGLRRVLATPKERLSRRFITNRQAAARRKKH